MGFKLTYSDGQTDEYDDSTVWTVDDGVLKMGRERDKWTVLVSPSHWATIELGQRGGGEPEKAERENGEDDKSDADDDKDERDDD